jgi:DNA-binding response OmpR family regulator
MDNFAGDVHARMLPRLGRLPGMDGFETVQRLRGQSHRATPVVFVTGNSEEGMRRAYEFGAVDYMVKSVDPDILRGKVRNLIALYDQGLSSNGGPRCSSSSSAALPWPTLPSVSAT